MFLSHRPNHNAKYKGRKPSEERIVYLNGRYIGDISKDVPRDDPRGGVYLWRWRACTFPEKDGGIGMNDYPSWRKGMRESQLV